MTEHLNPFFRISFSESLPQNHSKSIEGKGNVYIQVAQEFPNRIKKERKTSTKDEWSFCGGINLVTPAGPRHRVLQLCNLPFSSPTTRPYRAFREPYSLISS